LATFKHLEVTSCFPYDEFVRLHFGHGILAERTVGPDGAACGRDCCGAPNMTS
jgi:hypothetical protein